MAKWEFSGERFGVAIKRSGKLQRELSEELGCNESLISLYKLGYLTPTPSKLVALAIVLDVNVEDFFEQVDEALA